MSHIYKIKANFATKKTSLSDITNINFEYGHYSKYYPLELINGNLDEENMYFIIGHKNLHYEILINEIKDKNIACIFIPILIYTLEDIDYIFSDVCNNTTDFVNPEIDDIKTFNNFLIFDQNKYIGGLFEMYSKSGCFSFHEFIKLIGAGLGPIHI